jgi:hypothetical protein
MKECGFGEQATAMGDGKIMKTHWACRLNVARNAMRLYL